jgi:DNA-binding LacI/PurR family transcriptional regulator
MVRLISAGEQVAARLRKEILDGQWSGEMPGIYVLAAELGVNHKTVDTALRQLEGEGLLVAQGPGRRRRIVLPAGRVRQRPLRVAILPSVAEDRRLDYIVELRHELVEAGHVAFFPEKSLHELGMDVKRIARMVRKNEADAWVVVSASREVLEWFVGLGVPTFALFGRRRHLTLAGAGPDKVRAYREVVRHLAALGHRRIVLLALAARRLPEPGLPERAFLEELAAHDIPTGPFNLPDWEESPVGLQRLLDSLFKTTPPTALLIDEAHLFHAVKHHLSGQGIRIPGDVSLVCTDPDRSFGWCRPSIAHIRWDSGPVVRRIVRWAGNVARGRKDLRQTLTPAELVAGGTVGRVSGGRA